MNGPESVAALGVVVFAGSTVVILARAIGQRIANRPAPPAVPGETAVRIERMERALESVAIEVERISESQRFLTKLLAERERPALGPGSGGSGR